MKRLLLLSLTIFSFILVSCEPQSPEQELYSADSFLKDRYELNPLGDTIRLTVSTIGSWYLNKPWWLSASRTNGRGVTTVILTAEPNVTGGPLSDFIEIRTKETKRIPVSQANPYTFMENNHPSEYRWDQSVVEDSGSQSQISVNSNLYWRLELLDSLQNHFNLSPSEGIGDASITVTCIENNLDTADWVGKYRLVSYIDEGRTRPVSDIPGILEDTIYVRQGHFHFLVNNLAKVSAIYDKSDLNAQTFEIDLESDPDQPSSWTVKEVPDWLTVTKVDDSHLKIAPNSTNVTKNDRKFYLTLVATPSGAERVIEVLQEKYKFYFTYNDVEIESGDKVAVRNIAGESINVHFISSGPWKIISKPSQLRCNPSSGSEGDTPITITVPDQNFKTSELLLPLTVESNDSGFLKTQLQETLNMTQGAFRFKKEGDLDTLPSSKGGSKSIRFISSGALEVSKKPSWVNVSISSTGEESYTVKVEANSDNNSETAARADKIRLVCPGHENDLYSDINVVQMRSLFDLLSESSVSSIAAYDNPAPIFTISLLSSQNWSIDNSKTSSWITVSPTSGEGRSEPVNITCTMLTNTGRERSGQVVIKNNSGATKQITVTQDGFYFDTQKVSFNSAVGGDRHRVNISCYRTVGWSVDSYPSWISPDRTSGKGDASIIFTVAGNSASINERSATATIRNDLTGEEKTVAFKQPGYRWEVTNANSYTFDAFKGDSSPEFTLTAGGNWSILTPTWLKASTASGTGGKTYRIKFTTTEDNAPASAIRSATVTIVSEDFNNLNKTISVSQQNYRLDASPSSISLSRKKSDTVLTVNADGQWTASADQTWITLSQKSGSAGATNIKVTCSKARSDRQGTITLKDTKHPSIEVKILVTQKK